MMNVNRVWNIGLLALFCLLPIVAHADQKTVRIDLYSGEVRTIPVQHIERVAVGNGKLLTTTVLDKGLLLLAEGAGDTSLVIWTKDGARSRYHVHVTSTDVAGAYQQLSELLKSFTGIHVDRVGDNVMISGTASKDDLKRIDKAASLFHAVNLAKQEEVTMKKMIYMKVQILEFKKSAMENLGIDWQQSINGPAGGLAGDLISNSLFRVTPNDAAFQNGLPSRVSPPRGYLGIATTITSKINLALSNGDAYILATPELSTRSGGNAKFLAGGQVPIVTPASGLSPATVTYKDYGIKMNVTPFADPNNNIMAKIHTEVTSIDPAVTVQGNPGFLTRSTDSEINLRSGQTIVISGLVNSSMSNQVNKVPLLGDLPILGSLFRSTNFQQGRTDLVFFVTPSLVDPTSTINRERLQRGHEIRQRYKRALGANGIID